MRNNTNWPKSIIMATWFAPPASILIAISSTSNLGAQRANGA
jgi:hypothetical protein